MTAAIDLVVCLVIAPITEDEIAFSIALEACSGYDVEDSVGAVAVFGVITTALDFDIVDVFGIDLRADVAGNVCIRYGHAIDEPAVLVPTTDVKHVVDHVCAGHVVCNEGQAVGPVSAGRELNILTAEHSRGRHGVSDGADRLPGHDCLLRHAGQRQLEMQHRAGVGPYSQRFFLLLESFQRDRDRVVADRHGAEFKFSAVVRFLNLHPIGILSFQRDCGARNGQMLGIVNHTSYCAENCRLKDSRLEQTENDYSKSDRAHRPP